MHPSQMSEKENVYFLNDEEASLNCKNCQNKKKWHVLVSGICSAKMKIEKFVILLK